MKICNSSRLNVQHSVLVEVLRDGLLEIGGEIRKEKLMFAFYFDNKTAYSGE